MRCCTRCTICIILNLNRDPKSREILIRWPQDAYFVEIPNSENDRIARSLHVCDLLPTTMLTVRVVRTLS